MAKKSLLFVLPDYHSSFALRDAMRREGWKSDIFVSSGYDTRYLYASDVIHQWRPCVSSGRVGTTVNIFSSLFQYLYLAIRYRHHVHYSRLHFPPTYETLLPATLRKRGIHIAFALTRLLRTVHIHVPAGCRDEATREVFEQVEEGLVCGNCGFADKCDDRENSLFLRRASRYARFSVSSGFFESEELNTQTVRIKALDPQRWRPIARESDDKVVVLHSHALETRSLTGKNIKGTPVINDVMKRICSRHSHVEYRLVTGRDSHQMLAEQQQADIVIDQLYYGHWGSSGIEAMGTGAVVVAYLRADWITNFRREFSRYVDEIPVVSATAETLETVIETLVTDVELRRSLSAKSVNFARSFYDPESIALELARLLLDDRPWLNR